MMREPILHEKGADDPDVGLAQGVSTSPAAEQNLVFWKGLMRFEWRAQSRLMLIFIAGWLGVVWTLPQFINPGWILMFGLVYALVAGPAAGGSDMLEGCEEFSFALPATRQERFIARVVVAGGMLIVFTILDLLALGLDLSQAIARLYLDTGLVRTSTHVDPHMLYGLVLAFPLAVFSFSFALSANARSRALVLTSWFWGGLMGLVVLWLSLRYEFWKWKAWTGHVACSSLGISSLAALWMGLERFKSKEVVQPSKPIAIPTHWWAWVLLTLICALLGGFLVSSLSNEFFKMLHR